MSAGAPGVAVCGLRKTFIILYLTRGLGLTTSTAGLAVAGTAVSIAVASPAAVSPLLAGPCGWSARRRSWPVCRSCGACATRRAGARGA
ncbi:hypothetical protein FSW04_23330 [Baekduia soli]|uniref:Uncharacterized protein n=1 Tax=Baekduia soli TaxID=496014 RepID=A0A5B8UB03_9ACTN|nr:hypothetical protein [Baekduia soli]QEC50225.1 hypothetical protein FSW04_23330 [Baekduia soli]